MKKELIEKVKNLVKENKIFLENEGDFDMIKHGFSEDLIKESFLNGLIVEDFDLYPEYPNLKHKGKNYYCLYKYKTNLFVKRGILISFVIKQNIIIFHVCSMNYGSKEDRFYKKFSKNLSF